MVYDFLKKITGAADYAKDVTSSDTSKSWTPQKTKDTNQMYMGVY